MKYYTVDTSPKIPELIKEKTLPEFNGKEVTQNQKQMDVLFDYCEKHGYSYPY